MSQLPISTKPSPSSKSAVQGMSNKHHILLAELRKNLHTCLLLDWSNGTFVMVCKNNPALLKNLTVLWLDDWRRDSCLEVRKCYFNLFKIYFKNLYFLYLQIIFQIWFPFPIVHHFDVFRIIFQYFLWLSISSPPSFPTELINFSIVACLMGVPIDMIWTIFHIKHFFSRIVFFSY